MRNKRIFLCLVLLSIVFFGLYFVGNNALDYGKNKSIRIDNIEIKPYYQGEDKIFFIPSGLNEYIVDDEGYIIEKLDNVSTLMIDTTQKDLEFLNRDKNNKLDISCVLIDEKGNYDSPIYGTIKGRGNNSWITDKKSYNLDFNHEIDLFGMGKANKWVLVPNSSDPSGIKNKMVYDFVKTLDMKWAVDSEYVNLFINGEYNGLYLLCEKVEVNKERLDISKNGALLKRELNSRFYDLDNVFLSKSDNVIEIEYPESVIRNKEIENKVNQMEDYLLKNDNSYLDIMDLDSWVKCYLVDEFFDNLDAGIASAYFYIDEDGKMYRGPLWDYDSIMFDNPETVVAKCRYRQEYARNDYYYYLNNKKEFKEKIKEIFDQKFVSYINNDLDSYLDNMYSRINTSLRCDAIRWKYELNNDRQYFSDYLKKRSLFLKNYWDNQDDYCVVQILKDRFYETYVVKKGSSIKDAINIDMSLFDDVEYYNGDTDEDFNIDMIINDDIRIHNKDHSTYIDDNNISGMGLLNVVVSFVFVISFIILIYILRKKA